MGDDRSSVGNRKLVVLGIPWDVDTDGLRKCMSKYGDIEDIIVMKDRGTGRSRGFGYVTFSSIEGAEKALETKHVINGRLLEVKVATPKETMKPPSKKITRIFVARIPYQVDEDTFQRYFEKFGTVTDVYMPKDQGAKTHRGIGFITFEKSESVDKIMAETHELGGSTIAVDEATPKEESSKTKVSDRGYGNDYGGNNAYSASMGFGGSYGMRSFGSYDYAGSDFRDHGQALLGGGYGGNSWSDLPPYRSTPLSASLTMNPFDYGSNDPSAALGGEIGNKIFVGRLPSETTSDDLRRYFSKFGRILDVYIPKDSKRSGHRGFGFVTFSDEGAAQRVACRSHELLGRQVVIERATPPDEAQAGPAVVLPGAGGPIRGGMPAYQGSNYRGGLDYDNGWGSYGTRSSIGPIVPGDGHPLDAGRASRMDLRYRPY
eukprot:c23593_g1_i1 orf=490-1782(+)